MSFAIEVLILRWISTDVYKLYLLISVHLAEKKYLTSAIIKIHAKVAEDEVCTEYI